MWASWLLAKLGDLQRQSPGGGHSVVNSLQEVNIEHSVKNVFLKIKQNSRENTCTKSLFQ